MNTSDIYQSFIDQLITYKTFEQIESQFQPAESRLTKDLLDALAFRHTKASNEDKQQLAWLIEMTTYLYERKCLSIFFSVPYQEAITYSQTNILYLATQGNYLELESLIDRYSDQPNTQSSIKGRQSLLAIIAANAYVFAADWLQRRQLLLGSLVWLTHPVATSQLTAIEEDDPQNKLFVKQLRTLLNQCQQQGVELVVNALSIDWFERKAQASQGEEKVDYLMQAINLLSNQLGHRWAALLVKLGIAYQELSTGNRAQNLELAIQAYKQGLLVYDQQTTPQDWARIQYNLGGAYLYRILGNRADNLEAAIKAYQQALLVCNLQDMPQQWAMTQNYLGSAYMELPTGNKAENLELAIQAYEQALLIHTSQTMPHQWADAQINLGILYSQRIQGERAENLELAIQAFQKILLACSLDNMPQDWANAQINLGILYSQRIKGERAENIELAIRAYKKSLQVYTQQSTPSQWASIKNNLSIIYRERIRGNWAANLELAIQASEQAMLVYTQQGTSQDWAGAQSNLGSAYLYRILGNRADNLEAAIKAYQQALLVFTHQTMPYQWAIVQNNIGAVYRERIRGDKAENLELAIQAHEQTLLVYNQKTTPQDWAQTQNNLGNAYLIRLQGDRAQNLESAIQAYKQALQVYTQQDLPHDWAMVQNNIGAVYWKRIRGNKAENLELAIQAFEQALKVRTQQDMPHEWAATQTNLGNTYRERIRGEQTENLEVSIKVFERVLIVYTQENMPYDWAEIQNSVGIAYHQRIRGNRAQNLEAAIQAYEQALLIYNQQDTPEQWAGTQNNLGNAYFKRIWGDRAQNLEAAIQAYVSTLLVFTQQGMPNNWANTQNNLSNSYRERIQGNRSENLELAIQACEQALLVHTRQDMPHEWAATQNNLGNSYHQRIKGDRVHNVEQAIHAFEQALLIHTKETDPAECRLITLNLANLLYKEQRWQEAREAYQLAHEALELTRSETINEESRRQLAQENAAFYARLIHCCLLLDDLPAAATFVLAGKSRTLTEQLAGQRQTLTELLDQDPALAQEYAPIQQHRQELDELLALLILPPTPGDTRSLDEVDKQKSEWKDKVAALRQQINTLTDDLIFTHPALSAIQPLPPLTPTGAQALAAELGEVTFVEYFAHGGGWGALVITAQTLYFVSLADELMTYIEESFNLFLRHDNEGRTIFWLTDNWREQLTQLYRAVFEPLQPYLPSSGKLVIAPTQGLHLVPFQALRNPQGGYLSETYALSFVPSLATLRVLLEQAKRAPQTEIMPNRLLNISYSGGQHNHLENVALEAQEVGAQFAQPFFLGEGEATRDRVIQEANQQTYEVMHFNCHGSFVADSPAHSGLLLAQQQLLTINDIRVRIRLRGRPLVTLSACQTGQTLPEQGDETTGISWAFLAAGASSVLSSQWSVPDASTRELFRHFYAFRSQRGISEAEALQQAMGAVRQRRAYRDRPEYWAGFQVMGLPIRC